MNQERAFTADSPIGSYWLGHCTGFWLRGGRRSGTVEEIGLRPDGRVANIAVRRRGVVRSRLVVVPVEWVAKIDPWDEEIVLARRRDRGTPMPAPQLLPDAPPAAAAGAHPRMYERPPLPPPHERAQDFPLPVESPPIPAPAAYVAPAPLVEPEREVAPEPVAERRRRFGFRRPAPAPAERAPEIAAAAAAALAALGVRHVLHDEAAEDVEETEIRWPVADEAVTVAAVAALSEAEFVEEEEPALEEEAPAAAEPEAVEADEPEFDEEPAEAEVAAVALLEDPDPVAEEEPEPVVADEHEPEDEPEEDETQIAAAVALPEPEPLEPADPSVARRAATRGIAVAAVAATVPGRAGAHLRPAGRGSAGLARRGLRGVAIAGLLVLELAARGTQYGTAALIRLGRASRAVALATLAWTEAKLPLLRRGANGAAAAGAAAVVLGEKGVRRLAIVVAAGLGLALAAIVRLAQAGASAVGPLLHAGSGAARAGGSARANAAQVTGKAGSGALPAGAGAERVTARAGSSAAAAAAGATAARGAGQAARVTGKAGVHTGQDLARAGAVPAHSLSVALPAVGRIVVATFRFLGRAVAGAGRLAVTAVVVPLRWIGGHTGPVGAGWRRWRASRRWQEGRPEPLNAQHRPRRTDISLPPGVKLRPTPIEQTTPVGGPSSSRD